MKTPLTQRVLTAYKAKVVIEPRLAKQMRFFVERVPTECQWYTRVRREEIEGEIVFTLFGDILIPPQKVGPEDVDMDPIGVAKMWKEYEKLLRERLEAEGATIVESEIDDHVNLQMRQAWNWCHSHVNFEIKPSKTDNEQWQDWVKMHDAQGTADHPPMMFILNKKDEAFTRVYDPVTKIQFENIPIEIPEIDDPELDYVRNALANKLEKIPEKKPEPIKPNPAYMTPRSSSYSDRQTALWGGYGGSNGGGSQQLRKELGGASGESLTRPGLARAGNGNTHQTGGLSSARDTYFVLNDRDIKEITSAYNEIDCKTDKSVVEAAYKKLFYWIDRNGTTGTWEAIESILDNAYSGNTDKETYLQCLSMIGKKQHRKADATKVLWDLCDLGDHKHVLDLLDAVVAFDAVGEAEGIAALLDFLDDFLDDLSLFDDEYHESPDLDKPYQIPPDCKFKVLD